MENKPRKRETRTGSGHSSESGQQGGHFGNNMNRADGTHFFGTSGGGGRGGYNGSYMIGRQITVTEDMVIENVYVGDNTKTAYLLTDIYGQDHWTETM